MIIAYARLYALCVTQSRPPAAAVFDVGKTNTRLCAVDDHGLSLRTFERLSRVDPTPPYPHCDTDELYRWLLIGLSHLARDFDVHSVVPVTHGACAALVDDRGLVLPVMDYEFDGVSTVDTDYDQIARDFAHTASPKLPAGLNLGRQLFWQQRNFPAAFARATILPYPQYWAWRLSGARTWEPTSLGCHTDLWEPQRGFSALAKRMGWDLRFGRRANAWTSVGPPSAEVARATGLSIDCAILAGIHDSSASFLAHLSNREERFSVVSTGTWIVVMENSGRLDALREDLDMLANVDAYGDPVATARFMGGREYEAICGPDGPAANPSIADLEEILASRTLAMPSFSDQGGPFRTHVGYIEGRTPRTPAHRAALAALYCALMTDFCLERLDARGDVIVEGRFAANEAFTAALAALRIPQTTLRSSDDTGTLRGAATLSLLARGMRPEPPRLIACPPGPVPELCAARRRWQRQLPQSR